MKITSFWSPLTISFMSYHFESNWLAFAFLLLAGFSLVYEYFGFEGYKQQITRTSSTKKGRVTVYFDTETGEQEDLDKLNDAYAQTSALLKTLILKREQMKAMTKK